MALTLVTNPVGGVAQKIFAGFLPIEFVFKREDLVVTDTESGLDANTQINIGSNLTGYLSVGDVIYLYSEGVNYTYDTIGTITEITSDHIVIDIPYIETSTGGYINYFKNYFVEFQCVNASNSDINILPFNLQSDGTFSGDIIIDVSIVNDLNVQRGVIEKKHIAESKQEFKIQDRQVYTGSSEAYTLIDEKLVIVVYATETPKENEILNQFDLPKIYLGYPASVIIAHSGGKLGDDVKLIYKELDINENNIAAGTLGTLDDGNNGFLMWDWDKDTAVQEATKYVEFSFVYEGVSDFATPDFDYPDFRTQ